MKQYWKVGAVAALLLVLGGAAAGIIAAQEPAETSTPEATATDDASTPDDATDTSDEGDATDEDKEARCDHFLEVLAENLGIPVDQLESGFQQTQLDLLDEAVAEGRTSEERAAEIRARIESGEAAACFHPHPGLRHHGGPGWGIKGEVAEFLGITREELFGALSDGQSLAQVAEAQGVSRDDLIAFLLQETTEYVNQAVENGRITQERGDEILANAPERIAEMVDREGLPGPRFHDREGMPEDEVEAAGLRL